MKDYDLVVIGSGPGGYPAALKIGSKGKKVAIIEKDEIGGVCLNRGCIPTKSLIASANLLAKLQKAADFGIFAENITFNWGKILERKNWIVSKIRKALEFSLKKANVDIFNGYGKIEDPNRVLVQNDNGSTILNTKNILIATGTTPKKLNEFKNVLTSDDILNLEKLPRSISIIGAGAVGIEFANIFSTFGVDVTIYEIMPTILPNADKDISKAVTNIFQRKNIKIISGLKVSANEIKSEIILTTGRYFEQIETNRKMQTNTNGIYAAGDITGIANYAHVAFMQSTIAAENILGFDSLIDYSAIPSCVFINPEIASVGMTQQECEEQKIDFSAKKYNFAALGKSNCDGEIEGFVKMLVDNQTKKILGCHILGSNASDIIEEIAIAIKHNLTIKDISKTIHSHPTLPEAIYETAKLFD